MPTSENNNTNRAISRLVDGELPDEHLRNLLKHCEDNPAQWKTVALAFVESQVLAEELSALRSTNDDKVDVVQPHLKTSWSRWASVFSLAAIGMLAVGFGFGFGFGKFSMPSHFNDRPQQKRVVDFNPVRSGSRDDSFQFLVSEPDGSLRQVAVPLVSDPNELGDVGTPSLFPRKLIEQMQRQGREVEHYRQFVPVSLNDGRSVIVPIDNVRVKQKRYQ